jgi:Tfp pilus assembly protein PilV
MRKYNKRRWKRGVTYIEVLVASFITTVCVSALVNSWYIAAKTTASSNEYGIAYNLARQTAEKIKETGFTYTPEAPVATPTYHYFDYNQVNMDATPGAAPFRVITSVVSDIIVPASNPVRADDYALRTVTIQVYNYQTGDLLYQTATYLSKEGI